MKRPVSLVASLVLGSVLLAACDGAAGKPQLAEVCKAKIGNATKCGCYADALEKALPADKFAAMAKSVKETGELASGTTLSDSAAASAIVAATASCLQ